MVPSRPVTLVHFSVCTALIVLLLAKLTLSGRPFRGENGVVVALRRRSSMVLRGRPLAGRWSRVVGPSLLPPLSFRSSTRIRFSSTCAAPRATTPPLFRMECAEEM